MKKTINKYRRNIIIMLLITFVALLTLVSSRALSSHKLADLVTTSRQSYIILDAHNDTLSKVINSESWLPKANLGNSTSFEVDIPKLKQGGISVQYFGIWVNEKDYPGRSLSRTLALLNALFATIDNNQNQIQLAGSTAEIEAIIANEKIAAVAAIEGADALTEPHAIKLLYQLYDLGVRVIGFGWYHSNQLAAGYSGTYHNGSPSPPGLTVLGKKLIEQINRLGIILDVSHLPESSFWDVIEHTSDPVIASHSGAYSLHPHFRNLTDEQILAIAGRNGVVNIVFHAPFLTEPLHKASIATIVDHIDYVVDLTGIDYVGLGSDFDGGQMPNDLPNASLYSNIIGELLARGYSQLEIEKILAGNNLRVANQVWRDNSTVLSDVHIELIKPNKMGEIFYESRPQLSAKLSGGLPNPIQEQDIQVILDGKNISFKYDNDSNKITAIPVNQLAQGFHVLSFQATNQQNKVAYETTIFYIK
ncbi:MAG: dipeptidase [Bacillota bacterium]|nr:dipeptidase [Bacillota bacterium]